MLKIVIISLDNNLKKNSKTCKIIYSSLKIVLVNNLNFTCSLGECSVLIFLTVFTVWLGFFKIKKPLKYESA